MDTLEFDNHHYCGVTLIEKADNDKG